MGQRKQNTYRIIIDLADSVFNDLKPRLDTNTVELALKDVRTCFYYEITLLFRREQYFYSKTTIFPRVGE